MQMKVIRFAIFVFLCTLNFLIADGFLPNTLVKTIFDYVAIENLTTTDAIVSHDKRACQPISIISKIVDQYIKICIEDEYICAAPDQKFYLPKEQKWISAKELTPNHWLLKSDRSLISIDSVEIIEMPAKVYLLSLAKGHTFYVSKHEILVHNFAPFIGIGFSFAIGSGTIEFLGITITAGISFLGIKLGLDFFKGKDKKPKIKPISNGNGSNNGNDPNNKDKRRNGIYKGVGYHGSKHNGRKSAAPKDGQKALDNSVEVNKISGSRVGISEDEIVILNRTSPGEYHGHVRTWQELEAEGPASQEIRNTLQKNGLVKSNGKIIK
jgi:hypothetical protein